MTPVVVQQGAGPIVLGLPHAGTHVPSLIMAQLNLRGRALADTDWHVDRLYEGLLADVTMVKAQFHRYVIDANRSPQDESLYPGQNTTGLVPLTDFDGAGIWSDTPDAAEIEQRRMAFHAPYHAVLKAELTRVRERHGIVILYDCHSIRGSIPYLFEGRLPDFNIGTNGGLTCAPEIEAATVEICNAVPGLITTVNGRFKGGWTTRHYGDPANRVHAIQMELAQSTYLSAETPPWTYDTTKAARLRPHLSDILQKLADLAVTLKGKS